MAFKMDWDGIVLLELGLISAVFWSLVGEFYCSSYKWESLAGG